MQTTIHQGRNWKESKGPKHPRQVSGRAVGEAGTVGLLALPSCSVQPQATKKRVGVEALTASRPAEQCPIAHQVGKGTGHRGHPEHTTASTLPLRTHTEIDSKETPS